MPLALADFSFIKALVERVSGNTLEAQRDYIVETRLKALAEKNGSHSIPALIQKVRDGQSDMLVRQIVESLVNNETTFFRDMAPFEILREKVLPEMMARNKDERSLVLWSAACSSGQEPYSLAMLVLESFPQLRDWNVRILASDYSQAILNRAMMGRFSQIEVNRGLPAQYLVKYFERVGIHWHIKLNVRQMVSFLELNLAQQWPSLPRVDVVLLRNALIYFDVNGKRRILSQVERALKPGGYLFMGAAETTISLSTAFERRYDKASCYQLRA